MARRNLKEITGANPRLDAGAEHSNYQLAAETIPGVGHRAGGGRAEEGLFVGLSGPTGLEDRVHSSGTIGHSDHGNSTMIFHVEKLVWCFEAPDFDL